MHTKYTNNWNVDKRGLIDLAIEYGMVKSTSGFYALSSKAQEKILETIGKVADEIDWSGCFERIAA